MNKRTFIEISHTTLQDGKKKLFLSPSGQAVEFDAWIIHYCSDVWIQTG